MNAGGLDSAAHRARAFVLAHGDPLQRARAAALADPDARERVRELVPAPSDVASALASLAMLGAIGARRGADVERAVAFLSAAQRDDGSWSIAASEDADARIAATARVAGELVQTRCARPAVLDAARAFLAAHWSAERVQRGGAAMIAGYAQWFANADDELSDAGLQWCGRELERGYRSGAIDPLATARVFVLCDAPALPGARLSAAEVARSLASSQAADGGFLAESYDLAARVEATLDALAALLRIAPRALR